MAHHRGQPHLREQPRSGLLTTLWRAIGKPPPNKDRRSMTCVISWFHQRRRMKATCCSFRSCLALTPFPMPRPALSVSTASIKKAHFLRAIYEGVAFSHLYHTERLRNINPKLSHTIRIAGGVTNSPVWLQIFADIFRGHAGNR